MSQEPLQHRGKQKQPRPDVFVFIKGHGHPYSSAEGVSDAFGHMTGFDGVDAVDLLFVGQGVVKIVEIQDLFEGFFPPPTSDI